MKQEAIEALEAVREELRAAEILAEHQRRRDRGAARAGGQLMRRAWRVAELLLIPTVAARRRGRVAPDRAALEVHVWLLVVLGLAFARVPAARPRCLSEHAVALRGEPPAPAAASSAPRSLARLEREVSMAGPPRSTSTSASAPRSWSSQPSCSPRAAGSTSSATPTGRTPSLGDDVWELVRPDRPQPADAHGPGIGEAELERVVVALERV